MDCSACRSLFSESFDGRLAGERRQQFGLHLQGCPPCTSEFALYRRVFSAVAALPDGEAPPFRVPAEVPGALGMAHRFAVPPRFARVAAGFLLLLGLAGTHVLVFKWSRDHAASQVSPVTQVAEPVMAPTPPIAQMSLLPSALRDHVEATDLFIRTAAESSQIPGELDAGNLMEADYAVSNIERLTEDLRKQCYAAAPQRAQVEQYLRASDNFVNQTRRILERSDRSRCVRAICDAAGRSGVHRQLDSIRPLVVGLPLGTSFASHPVDATRTVMKLAPDGRLIVMSKQKRLAGNLRGSIEDLRQFETQFAQSRLAPLALYLHVDALLAAGQYGEAKLVMNRLSTTGSITRFDVIIAVNGANWPTLKVIQQPCSEEIFKLADTSTLPMKSERSFHWGGGCDAPPPRFVEDPMPKRAVELPYLKRLEPPK